MISTTSPDTTTPSEGEWVEAVFTPDEPEVDENGKQTITLTDKQFVVWWAEFFHRRGLTWTNIEKLGSKMARHAKIEMRKEKRKKKGKNQR